MRRLLPILLLMLAAASCRKPDISMADAQFDRGEFFNASRTYRAVYAASRGKDPAKRELRGRAAFRLGECQQRLRRPQAAAVAFRNALRAGYADSAARLNLAMALQADGKYQQAAAEYDSILAHYPDNARARTGLRGCRTAMRAEPGRWRVAPLAAVNSSRADFSPALLPGHPDKLYFTSSSERAAGDARSEITGTKRSDVFVSTLDAEGRWGQPAPAEGQLNSEADEGVIGFSPDGKMMYLSVARRSTEADTGVEIFTSVRSDAQWSKPEPFDVGAPPGSSVGHPAVSPDGRWLYFTSDMPGGFGGKDIWRLRLGEHREEPQNLGAAINTEGDEMFPYVLNDSTFLFASDGHPGFGGLDLFSATLTGRTARWQVDNLGLPLNSRADDFGIFYTDEHHGFLSSNRGDARGYDNIYTFELPDLRIEIAGRILDQDEEPVEGASIRIVGRDGSMSRAEARTDGTFSFPLQRGVSYLLQAGAPGYLNMRQEFTSDTTEQDATYEVDFLLVALDKPQVVENIFYDFDRATLRPESTSALDSLAGVLAEHPNISIRLTAHADRKGADAYNLRLSDRRAKAVVDYLIGVGVDPGRLSWEGRGKSQPKTITPRLHRLYPQFEVGTKLDEDFIATLSDEDAAAADQINRRTEFEITSATYNIE